MNEKNQLTDINKSIKFGLMVLVFGFGGFSLWASFAPLDEGVPGQGHIIIKNRRQLIQHPIGGRIEAIHVRDGDFVTENQTLLELDTTATKGQLQILKSQHQQYIKEEKTLKKIIPEREFQIKSLRDDISRLRPLADDDFYPKNRLNELERQLNGLNTQLEDERNRLDKTKSLINETNEKIFVTNSDLTKLFLKSPASGKVMNLQTTTIGGVVSGGSKIMEIVPTAEALVVEAKIAPHLAHFIKEQNTAQLRFSSLSKKATPTIYGNVNYVSPDVNVDEKGISTYTIRVDVPLDELRKHKEVDVDSIQPGMPVDVIVITGQRSFLTYLFKPFADRFAKSLIEK